MAQQATRCSRESISFDIMITIVVSETRYGL